MCRNIRDMAGKVNKSQTAKDIECQRKDYKLQKQRKPGFTFLTQNMRQSLL